MEAEVRASPPQASQHPRPPECEEARNQFFSRAFSRGKGAGGFLDL